MSRNAHRYEQDGFVRRNIVRILVTIVAVLVVLIIVFAVLPLMKILSSPSDSGSQQMNGTTSEQTSSLDEFLSQYETWESPYNWENLNRNNGRYTYSENGRVVSRLGIDVSENQGLIDWNAVAADGIDFAYVRLGYRGSTSGDLYIDSQFENNIDNARAAGLDTGVYFFSQATTPEEAREEARYVLSNLGGRYIEYPIAFDSEETAAGVQESRTSGLTRDQMIAIASAFCDTLNDAGYDTIIYGNTIDLSRMNRETVEKYGCWIAEYGMPAPTAHVDFSIWQYSNNGKVAGIDAAVDMNLDMKNIAIPEN